MGNPERPTGAGGGVVIKTCNAARDLGGVLQSARCPPCLRTRFSDAPSRLNHLRSVSPLSVSGQKRWGQQVSLSADIVRAMR